MCLQPDTVRPLLPLNETHSSTLQSVFFSVTQRTSFFSGIRQRKSVYCPCLTCFYCSFIVPLLLHTGVILKFHLICLRSIPSSPTPRSWNSSSNYILFLFCISCFSRLLLSPCKDLALLTRLQSIVRKQSWTSSIAMCLTRD